MNLKKISAFFATLAMAMLLAASWVAAQGIDTPSTQGITKDDWEEIQFDFNSSTLVDGFPSLLRLGELLQGNAAFRVRVEGHTDGVGSSMYNDRLAMQRATAVRDFLVKYGARAAQIETVSRGKAQPRAKGEKPYSPTDEARYMNRRVVLAVMDGQGRQVSAGSAGDAIRAFNQPGGAGAGQGGNAQGAGLGAGSTPDCCSEVLKRLDKLDEIAKALRDLADQNAALRKEVADLRQGQTALQAAQQASQDAQRNAQTTAQQALQQGQQNLQQGQQGLTDRLNQLGSRDQLATAAAEAISKNRDASHFQMLGLNAGPDNRGDINFSGRARYFQPFGSSFAVQAQGEYMY